MVKYGHDHAMCVIKNEILTSLYVRLRLRGKLPPEMAEHVLTFVNYDWEVRDDHSITKYQIYWDPIRPHWNIKELYKFELRPVRTKEPEEKHVLPAHETRPWQQKRRYRDS